MLRITQYGEDILTKKGEKVEVFDDSLKLLIDQMVDTMYEANGIGLAAQQIDKAIQLCVVDVSFDEGPPDFEYTLDGKRPPLDLIMPMELVNPEILSTSGADQPYDEGCLSFPDIRGEVMRPPMIEVKYDDADGNSHHLKCDGILARCIQHEVDHLNGILFIDRMSSQVISSIKGPVKKLKKETQKNLKKS